MFIYYNISISILKQFLEFVNLVYLFNMLLNKINYFLSTCQDFSDIFSNVAVDKLFTLSGRVPSRRNIHLQ
jgi:hypothetical protein